MEKGLCRISIVARAHGKLTGFRQLAAYNALDDEVKTTVRAILESHGCWYALWHVEQTDSGYDQDNRAPFARGISVYGR